MKATNSHEKAFSSILKCVVSINFSGDKLPDPHFARFAHNSVLALTADFQSLEVHKQEAFSRSKVSQTLNFYSMAKGHFLS